MSEAMCFGIGAGLGIWYLSYPGMRQSRLVHVRSADIEAQFFNRMGCMFRWDQFRDPIDAQISLYKSLAKGLPVIVQTDIYYLPYYNSKTHFPGHDITVWGYDSQERVFFVTDTEREDTLSVPFGNMRKAMYAKGGFFLMEGNQFAPASLPVPSDLPDVIRNAIVHNSRMILSEDFEYQGIPALEKWIGECEAWSRFTDWQWTARFVYQVIERRGTGGGGFRLMYADFLKEAAEIVPEISLHGLQQRMYEVAHTWTGLAHALKNVSEQSEPDFSAVIDHLRIVHVLESAYHHEVLGAFNQSTQVEKSDRGR